MTVNEILEELKPVKPMSRFWLYEQMRRLKIKPIGASQRPQRYPDDTAERILIRLGFTKHDAKPLAKPLAKGARIRRPKNLRSRRAPAQALRRAA